MEYNYPELGFTVSFPADPIVQTLPYKAPDGSDVDETLYSVREGDGVYTIAIVDLGNTDGAAAIDRAVAALHESGDVKLDIPARVNRNFGRQLSIVGKDGSHSAVAVFFANHRLYQIQGTILASSEDLGSGDGVRFQQSLRFTGDNGGAGFGGRQFRGGRRFRQDQAQPDQVPPTQTP
jgi:hypothetical protein